MADDNGKTKTIHRKVPSGHGDQGARTDRKHDQRSSAIAQLDRDDPQPGEGQPEIPKVGSRDAPGG